MKVKKICEGLTLTHKKDGIWLSFFSRTGLQASIHLANKFGSSGIIGTAILNWASEQLEKVPEAKK